MADADRPARGAGAGAGGSADGGEGGSGSGSGSQPADTWRKVLRGVGAAELAPDVRRLAAALHRIAAVSAAVAGPVVYQPLLAELQAGQPERARRRH